MKKLLSIFIALSFLAGCASSNVTEQPESILSLGVDFRPYTEKGFHFTPYQYSGEYESLGLIEVIYIPEFRKAPSGHTMQSPTALDGYSIYIDPSNPNDFWNVKNVSGEQLVKEAYELALEMGADAIVDFRIGSYQYVNGSLRVESAKIEGFAIKRNP